MQVLERCAAINQMYARGKQIIATATAATNPKAAIASARLQ